MIRANFITYHNARILGKNVGEVFDRFGAVSSDQVFQRAAGT